MAKDPPAPTGPARSGVPLASPQPGQALPGAPAPAGTAAAPAPSIHHGAIQSTVPATVVSQANFRPHAKVQATSTTQATAGLNPHPPKVASQSSPGDPQAPYDTVAPYGFAPFNNVN